MLEDLLKYDAVFVQFVIPLIIVLSFLFFLYAIHLKEKEIKMKQKYLKEIDTDLQVIDNTLKQIVKNIQDKNQNGEDTK